MATCNFPLHAFELNHNQMCLTRVCTEGEVIAELMDVNTKGKKPIDCSTRTFDSPASACQNR